MNEANERTEQLKFNELGQIYTQLEQRDIEQFYNGFQLWHLQHRLSELQAQADSLRQQIVDNTVLLQQVQPSAVALASLARFQSNGVTNLDLLERMMGRGEEWLDQAVQHLDYCERFDFIRGDYTQWCENALEGAFDWIDSIQTFSPASPLPAVQDESLTKATEALLLQKLSSEEEGAPTLEDTYKQPTAKVEGAAIADIKVEKAEESEIESVPLVSSAANTASFTSTASTEAKPPTFQERLIRSLARLLREPDEPTRK